MKRIFQISIFSLIACAEPFRFEVENTALTVVDAKISTMEGESVINIFNVSKDGEISAIGNLNVTVLDQNDNEITFSYNIDSAKYFPTASNFAGVIGERYRFQAVNNDGAIYSSSYDSIPSPYEFSVNVKDTTESFLSALNIIMEREAVAAIAEIPPINQQVYSKYQFKFSYLNPITLEINENPSDEFVLFSCNNSTECTDSVKVPIGRRIDRSWFFYNREDPCPETPNTGISCLANPCCQFAEAWVADFIIIQESLSQASFNYLERVQRLRNNDGLIFDTYPFPLEGNVRCESCDNEVVGFFRTVAETSQKIEVIL